MTEPLLSPEQFAQIVSQASDDQLRDGLAANRELILGEIFHRMPEALHAERAANLEAVIEWRIDGDRWQLRIRAGECTVDREGDAKPDVTLKLSALDFVKLVTGAATGPHMFVFGRLKVRGDLILAARLPAYFRIPRA